MKILGFIIINLFIFMTVASNAAVTARNQEQLVEASARGDVEMVNQLLNQGADPNGHDGFYTPLVRASQFGHAPVIEILLISGADPNLKDPYIRTAIDWALQERHEEAVYTLHNAGADINILVNPGKTTLMETVLSSIQNYNSDEQIAYQEKMYFWLWAVGFDTLKAGGRPGLILSSATRNSTPKLVKDLLDRKEFLDVLNNINEWGDTALISSVFNSSSEDTVVAIIALLLKNGADPNLRDDGGGSALSAAKYLGREKVIKLLMQYGAKE